MKKLLISFAALAMLALPHGVQAQAVSGKVTTANPAYTNNAVSPLSLDTSGGLRVNCITGCAGGGGGGNVNINQVGGVNVPTTPAAVPMAGDTAANTTDAGFPVKIGGVASGSSPGFVASGNRINAWFSQRGAFIIGGGANNPIDANSNTNFETVIPQQTGTTGRIGSISYLFNGTTWDRQYSGGTLGSASVSGGVAAGATDGGNPVKIGGVYNSTLPTYTNGQRTNMQVDANGRQFVTMDQPLPAGANIIGSVILAGGTSNFSALSAASTNSTLVKNGGATLYEISMANLSSSVVAYLKLYDAAAAPTCGSGTPVARYPIPFAASGGAGSNVQISVGKSFAAGLAYCITGGIADADTTAVAANAVVINMTYK